MTGPHVHQFSRTPPQGQPVRACCLCAGDDFEIVDTRDRRGEPLVTVMCLDCGLMSHRRIPTDEELSRYYEFDYRADYHGEKTPCPRRVMRAWRNGNRILRQLQPMVPESSHVLEVGAGLGCTVRQFQDAGYNAAGIDPGRDFTDYSINRIGANLTQQSLEDLSCPQKPDVILLVHVIEHMNHPDHSLRRIHQLLPEDGLLYVECPNLDAPVARRSRLFHFAHVYSFTPPTLRMLAELCGFELVRQFGHKRDPNLQMLFRRSASRGLRIRPRTAQRTLRRIRMSRLRYHLRPAYLLERIRKLASYGIEHVIADRFVRRHVLVDQENAEIAEPVTLPFRASHPPVMTSDCRRAA